MTPQTKAQPRHKTTFPKGHTRRYYVTKNMSAEYILQAQRIAGLRHAAGMKGWTVESVVLDCLRIGLPSLENDARAALDDTTKRSKQK